MKICNRCKQEKKLEKFGIKNSNKGFFGFVAEHRLKVEKKIGRYLKKSEVVHHKNHTRDDNRPSNLEVITKPEHDKLSKKKKVA